MYLRALSTNALSEVSTSPPARILWPTWPEADCPVRRAAIRFHILIGQATGNPLYPLLVADTQQAVLPSLALALRRSAAPAELDRVQLLYSTILDAIAAGDPGAARDAMTQNFDDVDWALDRLNQTQEE